MDFDAEVFPFGIVCFGILAEFLEGFGEGVDLIPLGAFLGAEVPAGEEEFDLNEKSEQEPGVQSEREGVGKEVWESRHGGKGGITGNEGSERLTKENLRVNISHMKRVLSVLLLIPFLCTQAWAIRGGPFDGLAFRDLGAISGLYGVAMYGLSKPGWTREQSTVSTDAQTGETSEPYSPQTGGEISTTAVMNLNLPVQGIADGQILLFYKGLMFVGYAKGMVNRKDQSLLLMSELSHYTILSGASYTKNTGSEITGLVQQGTTAAVAPPAGGGNTQNQNGVQSTPVVLLDRMMSGRIDLKLDLDYFTGLISVGGVANYAMVTGDPSASGDKATWSVLRDFAYVEINRKTTDTGATETTTVTTAPDINSLRQVEDSTVYLKMAAEGYRLTDGLAGGRADDYAVPAADTFYQIGAGGVQQTTTGGGGVGGGGGGAGGGRGGGGGVGGVGAIGGGVGALGGALGGGIPGGVGGAVGGAPAPAPVPAVR